MTEEREHRNPMLDRLRRKEKTGKAYNYSPKQEKNLAKSLNKAWRVPASGRGRQKGDVRAPGVLRVECKATQRKSFSITREMLDKIEAAAGATGEIPVVQVDFLDEAGKVTDSVIVAPAWALHKLQDAE